MVSSGQTSRKTGSREVVAATTRAATYASMRRDEDVGNEHVDTEEGAYAVGRDLGRAGLSLQDGFAAVERSHEGLGVPDRGCSCSVLYKVWLALGFAPLQNCHHKRVGVVLMSPTVSY
jgi:hypothetical protein